MMELSELTLKVRELAVATGAFIREERKKFSRERIEKNSSLSAGVASRGRFYC